MTENPDEESPERERPSNSRWWEQYTVRYFVGTVAGVLSIYVLREYAALKDVFANIIPKVEDLGDAVVLGSVGLAYCYVASAPILTIHAVRAVARLDEESRCKWLVRIFLPLVPLLMFFVWVASRRLPDVPTAWLIALLIVSPQVLLLYKASGDGFASTHEFYKNLVKARRDEWLRREDFVDSYRHLREHGNAKSILALEIILGVMIGTAQSGEQLLFLLFLWMLPSTYCWLIGTVLEARFANNK
jgi:hypothetical protein